MTEAGHQLALLPRTFVTTSASPSLPASMQNLHGASYQHTLDADTPPKYDFYDYEFEERVCKQSGAIRTVGLFVGSNIFKTPRAYELYFERYILLL